MLDEIRKRCIAATVFTERFAIDLIELSSEALFQPSVVREIANKISSTFPKKDPYSGAVQYALTLMKANACRMDEAFNDALANYRSAKKILSSDKMLRSDPEIVFAQSKAILEGKAELHRIKLEFKEARKCYSRVLNINQQAQYTEDLILNICNIAAIDLDMAEHGYHGAAERGEETIKKAEMLLNSHSSLAQEGTVLGIKGRLHSARGDFIGAAKYFNSAANIFRKDESLLRRSVRASRFEAFAFIEAGEIESARLVLSMIPDNLGTPFDNWRTNIASTFSLASFDINNWSLLLKIIPTFDKFCSDTEMDKVKCMLALVSGLCDISKISEAIKLAQDSFDLAKKLGVLHLELTAKLQLIRTLRLTGESLKAMEMLQTVFKEMKSLPVPDSQLMLLAKTEWLLNADGDLALSKAHQWGCEVRKAYDVHCSNRQMRTYIAFYEALANVYAKTHQLTPLVETIEAASKRLPITGSQSSFDLWRIKHLENIAERFRLLGVQATILLALDCDNELVLCDLKIPDSHIRVNVQKISWNDELRILLAVDMKNTQKEYDHQKLIKNALGINVSAEKHEILWNVLQTLSDSETEIIYVVANGIWNNFPFESFIQHPVSRIPNLTMLETLLNRASMKFAFPPIVTALCSSIGLPLSISDRESIIKWNGVTSIWPHPQASNLKLSISDIYKHMNRSNFVHFATHGRFEQNSRITGLTLELEKTGEQISMLHIIENVKFRYPAIVYLNSCESAMIHDTKTRRLGMPYAFLDIGASSCIACLRKVPDLIAAIVCDRFYEYLIQYNKYSPAFAIFNSISKLTTMTEEEIIGWAHARFDALYSKNQNLLKNAISEVNEYWNEDSKRTLGTWLGYRCFGLGFNHSANDLSTRSRCS